MTAARMATHADLEPSSITGESKGHSASGAHLRACAKARRKFISESSELFRALLAKVRVP